jgi:hypothetical protein
MEAKVTTVILLYSELRKLRDPCMGKRALSTAVLHAGKMAERPGNKATVKVYNLGSIRPYSGSNDLLPSNHRH